MISKVKRNKEYHHRAQCMHAGCIVCCRGHRRQRLHKRGRAPNRRTANCTPDPPPRKPTVPCQLHRCLPTCPCIRARTPPSQCAHACACICMHTASSVHLCGRLAGLLRHLGHHRAAQKAVGHKPALQPTRHDTAGGEAGIHMLQSTSCHAALGTARGRAQLQGVGARAWRHVCVYISHMALRATSPAM